MAREDILKLRISDFVRAFCVEIEPAIAQQRLLWVATCLDEERGGEGSQAKDRGHLTVADLLELPDRPLRSRPVVAETITVFRGVGQVVVRALFQRLQELGLTPDPQGYHALTFRARNALAGANLGGLPGHMGTRATFTHFLEIRGKDALRKALYRNGEPTVGFREILDWLGGGDFASEEERLKQEVAASQRRLSRAEHSLRAFYARHEHVAAPAC
jgi:hypothetical protein